MDYEISDYCLAYTLVAGDIFLHNGDPYWVISNDDDGEKSLVLARDSWDDRFDFVFDWDDQMTLIFVVDY